MAQKKSDRLCKYCAQVIEEKAKVCPHCGWHQNRFINSLTYLNLVPTLISIGLLILAFLQFSKAREASEQAMQARKDILEVSRAVMDIAEIIPRSTGGFGASVSPEDRQKLKEYSDFLKAKLKEFDQKQK